MGVFHTCLSFNGQLGFRPKRFLSWYKSKFWNRITEPVYLREIFKKQVGLNKTWESLSLCQRGGRPSKKSWNATFKAVLIAVDVPKTLLTKCNTCFGGPRMILYMDTWTWFWSDRLTGWYWALVKKFSSYFENSQCTLHSFGWHKELGPYGMKYSLWHHASWKILVGSYTVGLITAFSQHQLVLELSTAVCPSSLWHLSSPKFALAGSCSNFHEYEIILIKLITTNSYDKDKTLLSPFWIMMMI